MTVRCLVLHHRRWQPHLEANANEDWVLAWHCPLCCRTVRRQHVGRMMDDAI